MVWESEAEPNGWDKGKTKNSGDKTKLRENKKKKKNERTNERQQPKNNKMHKEGTKEQERKNRPGLEDASRSDRAAGLRVQERARVVLENNVARHKILRHTQKRCHTQKKKR